MPPSLVLYIITASAAASLSEATEAPHKLVAYDPAKAQEAARIDDPDAATRAYLHSVPVERRAMTKAYALGDYFLSVTQYCATALILLILLGTGFSARLRNWAERLIRFRVLQTAVYTVLFLLLLFVLLLPLDWYQGYYRQTHYNLLQQNLGDWLANQAKGLAVLLVTGCLLLIAVYAVLRRAPGTWWLWGWAVAMVFFIIGTAIAPVFLAPLFHQFTPVRDASLREKLLTLAHEQGIPADDVYEMDASRNTNRIGAYVAGMFGTTRIVLFDTMLMRCNRPQIEMIMGHEMGHYVLHHIWKSVGIFGAITLAGFGFLRWAFPRIIARWPAAGIRDIGDVAGLPLLLFLLLTYFLFATPLVNTWSRTIEAQADDFGLDVSRQPDAAATTFLMLGEYRDLDPDPMVEAIFFNHPSGRNRIRNAMAWKKAHHGEAASP